MIKPALTSLRRNSAKLLLASCLLSLMLPIGVYADDDDDSGPWHVIVDNWQTHKPRVTALRSLNAYLATDKGQAVYYVPTLEELPNIKNAVADTTDYRGNNQKFAAVYDGYFDQMCYEALVRKSDGTYSKTPAIVQSEGRDKVRELTTLGYDFLLTDETITDIAPSGEDVNAGYSVHKLDLVNGRVDLNTALMDIYKAVGQEKYDITYIFTPDSGLTVTSSPIQGELSLNLSQYDSVDNSAGKAWVFVTRTNPSLYWKQAVYEGPGLVVCEPTYKHIVLMDLDEWGGAVTVDDGLFYACEGSTKIKTVARSTVSSAVMGGEGLFNTCLVGHGVVALECRCPEEELIEITLNNDTIRIDGNYAIAWSEDLRFTVEKSGKSLLGSEVSGEGFVNVYSGTGRVLLMPQV